jgi:hypothetical protein
MRHLDELNRAQHAAVVFGIPKGQPGDRRYRF